MSNQPSEKASKAVTSFKKRMNRNTILSFASCVHCGMCVESCHYYLATRDPKMTPVYKADQVRKLYKKHFDWTGRVFPAWVGGKDLVSDEQLAHLQDVVYGSCTACRRCTVNCPMGIDVALIIRTMRGVLTEQGYAPEGVKFVANDQWTIGNQMGVSKEEYLETIEWLQEELQGELGDPTAEMPIDKPNCDIVYAINPREVKYAPMSLLAAGKIFHLAGASWTLPSEGWDNTNFGLFNGDNALGGHMGKLVFDAVERLNGKELIVSECGHGFRSTKWESPNWAGRDLKFPIRSFLELMCDYVNQGLIKLDPALNAEAVTYHDPCNLARSSGMTEEPRFLLQRSVQDFREMVPNRADNFCCSGGGGAMSMSEYSKRRLEVAVIKADQLKATGAKIVATACHNCVDGLTDCIKHYKLGMKVKLVGELVADAMVMPVKVTEVIPRAVEEMARGHRILVVDDEPDMVTFLTTFFEDNGFEVASANNFEEAMAEITANIPDMITLDIVMPGKSGLDIYRELRTNPLHEHIPVVMVTGINPENPGEYDHRAFIYQHALRIPEGYLEKPVDKELLLLTVRKLFEQRAEVKN